MCVRLLLPVCKLASLYNNYFVVTITDSHIHACGLTAEIYYVHFPKKAPVHPDAAASKRNRVYEGPESPGYVHYPVGEFSI